jgi:capsular polysaccharide transport system permease protein
LLIWRSGYERVKKLGPLFFAMVIIPTVVSVFYFGLLASDIYTSESQFIVRSQQRQTATGLGMLLRSTGIGSADDESQAAQNFIMSRDALRDMNKDGAVLRAYTRPEISLFNRFAPLNLSGTFEDLYAYYQGKMKVEHESNSAVIKLAVRAYTASDAQLFNRRALELSERLVNRLSERARADTIQNAQREVDEAQRRATAAAVALAEFRNEQGVIDPDKQAAVQLQMVSKLQDSLIASRAELAQIQALAAQNPQVPILRARVAQLTADIDAELGKVTGGRKSLSSVAVRYQRLQLESQYADKLLAANMAAYNDARNEAVRKQVYVERIVEPNLPDYATEPRRLRGIVATLVLGVIAWGVLSLLLAGVREHRE